MPAIVIVFIMLKSSGSTLCVIQFAIIVFLPLQNCYLLNIQKKFLLTLELSVSDGARPCERRSSLPLL